MKKQDSITLCVNYLQKHIDKTLSLQEIAKRGKSFRITFCRHF